MGESLGNKTPSAGLTTRAGVGTNDGRERRATRARSGEDPGAAPRANGRRGGILSIFGEPGKADPTGFANAPYVFE